MLKIKFRELENSNAVSFSNAKELVESSYADFHDAIGNFRLPAVANGRYKRRHPIENEVGDEVGALIKGVDRLGYTYACLYSNLARCFFIAHCPFNAVWGSPRGHDSYISIVEPTGKFLVTGKGIKFEPTTALALPAGFVDYPIIFKTVNDGKNLLYVSKSGITFIDLRTRSIISTISFEGLRHSYKDFALSPKVNVLAVVFSNHSNEDPLTGEWRYKNFIRLYHLEQGSLIGEQELSISEHKEWKIHFGSDGRTLLVYSGDAQHSYELQS